MIERKARPVTIYSIEIEWGTSRVIMTVTCSKGTYIRTLCEDIEEKLAHGGCMEGLLRTATGGFLLKDSRKLAEIEALQNEGRLRVISAVDEVLSVYPALLINSEQEINIP